MTKDCQQMSRSGPYCVPMKVVTPEKMILYRRLRNNVFFFKLITYLLAITICVHDNNITVLFFCKDDFENYFVMECIHGDHIY